MAMMRTGFTVALVVCTAVALAGARSARAQDEGAANVAPAHLPAPEAVTPPPSPASQAAAARDDSVAIPPATVEVVGTPVAIVRGGAGPQHEIVATLAEGDRLEIDARAGEWYHLRLPDGRSGWVHEDLLETWVDPRRFEFRADPGRPSRMRSFHIAAFGGAYAADREDNGFLLGVRIGYSITSRFAFEAGVGWTSVMRSTYVIEQIYGLRLEEEEFDLFFYEAGGTMDILPNRRVTPFLSAAVGASVLNSRVEPTWAVGVGTKFFLTPRTGLRWELRNHRLHAGNQFTRFAGDNLEFSGGFEMLF